MRLNRMGVGATTVITEDITQIDLPNEKISGLKHLLKVLKGMVGNSFTFFSAKNVIHRPLVRCIVVAYENYGRVQS